MPVLCSSLGLPGPDAKDPSDIQSECQHYLREEPPTVGKASLDLNPESWLLETGAVVDKQVK